MKSPAFMPHRLQIFCLGLLLLGASAEQISAQPAPSSAPAKQPKVISNFRELLDWLPKGFVPRKGVQWTQVQKDAANEFFAKKLQSEGFTVDMRLPVTDVPTWNEKLQIYSEIPNQEGYHIRFFGVFPDTKKPELAKVKIGERVRITGKLKSLKYHTLWDQFTLSIVCDPSELTR